MADENVQAVVAGPTVKAVETVPEPTSITVDGKVYTPEQIKRHAQQAAEINKFVASPFFDMQKKGVDPAEVARAMQVLQGLNTQTTTPTPKANPDELVMTQAELDQHVDSRINETLTKAEQKRAVENEKNTVIETLRAHNVVGSDWQKEPLGNAMMAGVLKQLNDGIPDDKGGIVAGSAAVDAQGKPIPATKEQIEQATNYFLNTLIEKSRGYIKGKIGEPPKVPPATGTGQTVSTGEPAKDFWSMTPDERKAANKEWLASQKAGGGSASGLAT